MTSALDRLSLALAEALACAAELRAGGIIPPGPPVTAQPVTPGSVTGAIIPRKITSAGNDAIVAEYSTVCPFSKDNKWLLLIHPKGQFALYSGDGQFIRILPPEINTQSEPRWSRTDPDSFFFLTGNQLRQCSFGRQASTAVLTVIRSFPEYTRITGKGESDISEDGDHFVFCGDDKDVFAYTVSTYLKGPALNVNGLPIESLYITPDNNILISWVVADSNKAKRLTGIDMFDLKLKLLRRVAAANGHKDVTRDNNGDEIMVWVNAADDSGRNRNAALDTCPNGLVKVRLADGKQTCLHSMDWSLAAHVSAPDNRGWILTDTYKPNEAKPVVPDTGILMVSLDGSGVRYLCDPKSRPFNSYNWQPKVSVSRDGSRFVFCSNSGVLQDNPEAGDVWLGML